MNRFDTYLQSITDKRSKARTLAEEVVYSTIGVVWHAGIRFAEDRCFSRARSLAYTSLLSLIPIGALIFAFFRVFKLESLLGRVQETMLQYVLPTSSEKLDQVIEYIRQSTEHVRGVGAFGVIFLLIVLWSLINEIELHFNDVWKIASHRKPLDKFKSWWSFITLAPAFIALSVTFTSYASQTPIIGPLLQYKVVYVLIPLFITWAAFVLAYFLLPNTQVQWQIAVVGGIAAGSLWELTKIGFEYYLKHFASYNVVYGSLALVPIFLISLYLTWTIVLLGVELCYVIQNYEQLIHLRIKGATEYRECFALLVVAYFARKFLEKRGAASDLEIARRFGLRRDFVNSLLVRLQDSGILLATEEGEFLLSSPPDKLYPSEVIRAVSGASHGTPPGFTLEEKDDQTVLRKITAILSDSFEGQEAALDKKTIGDLVDA